MGYLHRSIEKLIQQSLDRHKSVLLLGPRQTGKTTLLNRLQGDYSLSFVKPDVRQRYEQHPMLLAGEIEELSGKKGRLKPLVLLDEIQKVPQILDVVQDLIDREIADFVITGSSARKLRRGSTVNLLPGRVVSLRLDPLTLLEIPERSLENHLSYGSLPGIVSVANHQNREMDLESYVVTYLEEEIRAEAVVRNVGSFARFLEYAGLESGRIINFTKLSQEIGVAHTTIASYFEILEDCLIIERIEPITESKTRKKLTRSQKYVFFDLGVRRVCAKEHARLHPEMVGYLFEQFIGLELIRQARLRSPRMNIKFWRDPAGPEIDWVIEQADRFIPIEVKWTQTPERKDMKYLKMFLKEYPQCPRGYLVSRSPRRVKLDKDIVALPWQELLTVFE